VAVAQRWVVKRLMSLKVTAFKHPEYDTLLQRNGTQAVWWGIAHVFFVLFSGMAAAMPLVLVLMALISSDIPKQRLLSVGISSCAACLLIAAVGFCIRRHLGIPNGFVPGVPSDCP